LSSKPMLLVLVTFPKKGEYLEFVREVVENRLAAGVNMVSVNSLYRWRGKVEEAEEVLLVIKTSAEAVKPLKEFILRNHPYEVPQIIILSPEDVHQPYLTWVLENTATDRKQ